VSFQKDRRIHYLETDIQGRETERKHILEVASDQQAKLDSAYSQCDQLQLELKAKGDQVTELQRGLRSTQSSRDRTKDHNDFLKRCLDEAYQRIEMLTGETAEAEANDKRFKGEAQRYRGHIKQEIRGLLAGIDCGNETPGELIDQGAAMIKDSIEKGHTFYKSRYESQGGKCPICGCGIGHAWHHA